MTATIALTIWPFIAVLFYRLAPLPIALCLTIIGGYLLLPPRVGLDLPLLPSLDKNSIPALSALAMTLIASRDPDQARWMQPGWLPGSRAVKGFLVFFFIGIAITVVTNTDGFSAGPTRIPGHSVYDLFSFSLTAMMSLIPFFLARKLLASSDGQRALVNVLIGAAVCYSLLALWEVRMSPQLNRQLYGFFAHIWQQHVRGDGFRPLVFLSHGLLLGIFFASAIAAAFSMARWATKRQRMVFFGAGLWLLGTLFLAKSLGAFLIVLAILPVALMLPRRMQVMVSASIVIIVFTYPFLRHVDLVPTDTIVSLTERIDPKRAQSLDYRFANEDALLQRARERSLFGWGEWGRSRIYDENGRDISTTDGRWVILFGEGGWVRYICYFGLLTWGIVALLFRRKDMLNPVSISIVLALTANLIDMLPNSAISPLTWLMAGALVGRLEQDAESPVSPEPQVRRREAVYRRDLGASAAEPPANGVSPDAALAGGGDHGPPRYARSDLREPSYKRRT